VGYKTQNNYDDAERERTRSLPWQQRHNWRGYALFALILAIVAAYFWASVMR
jgi:hypothetical protein